MAFFIRFHLSIPFECLQKYFASGVKVVYQVPSGHKALKDNGTTRG